MQLFTQSGQPASKKPATLPWNRLPQLMNYLRYKFFPHLQVVGHEPIHLEVFMNSPLPQFKNLSPGLLDSPTGKEFDLESFKFALEQVPAIQSLRFSGWGEPFLNSDLFRMVNHAVAQNGATTTVVTSGLLLRDRMDELMGSQLHRLVVLMNGHKPSVYSASTDEHPSLFIDIQRNVEHLIQVRNRNPYTQLQVELSMIVDTENFWQVPEMIRFAEALGVDAVRFENYAPRRAEEPSSRTIYRHNLLACNFLAALKPEEYSIQVTLPVPLASDASYQRNCLDPYTSVGVNGDCHVTACSRQLIYGRDRAKIWNADFWNNNAYQQLRQIHRQARGNLYTQEDFLQQTTLPVPMACQRCPKSMADAPKVLNPLPELKKK